MKSVFGVAAAACLGLLLVAAPPPARAGGYEIAPGASVRIDVGDRSNYTTVKIRNRGAQPGQLEFGAPINQTVAVPAGGQAELYGIYGDGSRSNVVSVRNTGAGAITVISSYMETPPRP